MSILTTLGIVAVKIDERSCSFGRSEVGGFGGRGREREGRGRRKGGRVVRRIVLRRMVRRLELEQCWGVGCLVGWEL